MSGSTTPKYSPAQNMADRQTLLATGVPMQTKLGTFTASGLGSVLQVRLRNVGIITGLSVRVTVSLNISGAMTASPLGPYPFIAKHSITDYNTTERVFASGAMLYQVNSFRHGRPWMPTGQGLVDTLQTRQDTGTGATQVMEFNVEIPVAYDAGNDLRGAMLAQTVVGELFYKATIANALVGDAFNSPYTAGTAAINSITFDVWQRYIQPQSSVLPLLDLNTVYEIAGIYQTNQNIVTNGTTYIDYPNVRSVLGAYFTFVDNGALAVNGTDISSIYLVANGNTRMREQDPLDVRKHMRLMLGGDLPAACYYIPSRRQPIQTWIYSQVQQQFNWATVTSTPNPYLAYAFESMYPLNTPLPGIAASAS